MSGATNGNGPQGQQQNGGQQGTGAGDSGDIDLELGLGDGEGGGNGGGGEGAGDLDGGNGGDGGDGTQLTIEQQIQAGIQAAIPVISASFQSEMDRRINQALKKVAPKPAPKQQEQQEQQQQEPVVADVRGARLAFREYLPESIRLFSDEERALAREYGQAQIAQRAAAGFDDEDEVGREVAKNTAEFLIRARKIYSARTKAVLERQGVLVTPAGGGQSPHGQVKGAPLEAAYEKARKKDMELFPQRYADQQQ